MKITMILSKLKKLQIPIILLLTIAVYFNMLGNTPVFDDHFFIEGEHRSQLTLSNLLTSNYPISQTGVYRPVRNIFYILFIPIFKSNPTPYHVFNLSLHLLIVFLVFKLTKELTKSKYIPPITTLIFALHPIHVESVSWITAGFDLVFVVFYLLSFLSYIKNKKQAISVTLSLLALFSNEISITLPIVFFLYEYIYKKSSFKEAFNKIVPFLFIAIVYWTTRTLLLTKKVEIESIYPLGLNRILLPVFIIGSYLKQLTFPTSLTVDHYFFKGMTGLYDLNHNPELPHPDLIQINTVLPILLGLILIFTTLYLISKKEKLGFMFGYILISILPVSSIIPIPILYSERYAYLASVGFSMLLAMFLIYIQKKFKAKQISLILIVFISLFYSYKIIDRNKDWSDDLSLWTETIRLNPDSVVALNSLGTLYSRKGDHQKSLEYYEKSIDKNPHITKHQKNLSSNYLKLGMYQENIDFLTFLLSRYKNSLEITYSIGESYENLKDYKNALKYYQQANDLLPNNQEIIESIDRISQKLN